MEQQPVYWSAAMPERVSNRQEIPGVLAAEPVLCTICSLLALLVYLFPSAQMCAAALPSCSVVTRQGPAGHFCHVAQLTGSAHQLESTIKRQQRILSSFWRSCRSSVPSQPCVKHHHILAASRDCTETSVDWTGQHIYLFIRATSRSTGSCPWLPRWPLWPCCDSL
jgi:hypothetical protein